MKKFTLLSILLVPTLSVSAQQKDSTKAWIKGGAFNLNFSQSSFTNWAAGGENAISGAGLLNLYSNYKKDKTTWDNSLDLVYGMVQSGKNPPRKNDDKIDFVSKYGHTSGLEHWYYSAFINFKSQFTNGYNFPNDSVIVSRFMAPAYVVGAIGIDYKPNAYFTAFISPLTSKTTIVNDQRLADEGAYGVNAAKYDSVAGVYVLVEHGDLVRSEFGGFIRMEFKKDIAKNVNLATKLELFSDYLDRPQNIDVNWEVLIGMKINKFLSASFSTQMIYDNDIPVPVKYEVNGLTVAGTGPRLQFREVLAIGLSLKF